MANQTTQLIETLKAGGWLSGIGREGSVLGMDEYLHLKYMSVGGL